MSYEWQTKLLNNLILKEMIVSENGTFLNMELPKRGTSMAPMVTKVNADDFIINKKVRYESKLKEEKVVMPPADFRAWRSRLDTLK